MHAISALGVVAFALCFLLTPLCRDFFLKLNIVDRPDGDRKFHLIPIPRIGGIAIVLSYAGAMGIMFLLAPHGARIYVQHQKLLLSLLPAAGIIFLTGLIDDLIGLKPWQKLAGQFVGASIAVSLGVHVSNLHRLGDSPWITIPFSLVWLIGCANAVNLIDGMDGLASGVGLFATLATLVAALVSGNVGLAMATVPLVGCLLAFLRYNFSPASVFLGDCGSLTIGFMLGCFGLIWSQHGGSLFGMALPLMALSLPLIDVCLAIGRRSLRSVPIFKADRGHIHHMVLARGFTPHTAALILYGFCALAAVLALLQTFIGLQFRGPIFFVFGGLIWIGVSLLGYTEFRALRNIFSRKRLLSLLKHEIYLQEFGHALAQTTTVDEFWEVVRAACEEMHFTSVQMFLNENSFEETFDENAIDATWSLTLTLGQRGHIILTRSSAKRPPKYMMSVLEYLQDTAGEKELTLIDTTIYTDAA